MVLMQAAYIIGFVLVSVIIAYTVTMLPVPAMIFALVAQVGVSILIIIAFIETFTEE